LSVVELSEISCWIIRNQHIQYENVRRSFQEILYDAKQ
jgi:hypothetical protein